MGTWSSTLTVQSEFPTSHLSHLQPLPNGKVLWTTDGGQTYVIEPNFAGSYANLTARRVQDCPRPTLYASHSLANDGKVWVHGGEYGLGNPDTAIFDPATETWSVVLGSQIASHTAVAVLDDGKFCSNGFYLAANATTPASRVTGPAFYQTETGLALLPDGRLVSFGGSNITVIRPSYSPSFVAAGSFDGDDTSQILPQSSALAALGTPWYGSGGFLSQEYITYEMGPLMWMPKINRVAFVSGGGGIFTWDPATGTLARPADCGIEPTSSITPFNLGTVHANSNGLTVAQIASAGTFTFTVPDVNTWNTFSLVYPGDALRRRVHVYTDAGTRCIAITFTSASFNSGTLAVTLSGCGVGSPNANFSATVATGNKVVWGRPNRNAMDQAGVILPNGDLLFVAGFEYFANGGNFNTSGRIVRWDGTSPAPVDVSTGGADQNIGGYTGQPFGVRMCLLPDGSVLVAAGTQASRYIPDSSESTPMSGAKPVITSFPNQFNPGDTLQLAGTTLNGIHEGGAYGDDSSSRSNFPIVRLTNTQTGDVHYCRTTNLSYRGIQPGRSSSCSVVVPMTVPPGQYQARVVANGTPSDPQTVTIGTGVLGDVILVGRP